MRMLDLFSGIGGFSLAAEWTWGKELEIVGFVEIDSFCGKILKQHWNMVPLWSDIATFNGNDLRDIEIITGGFPCQDISIAGKGVGIEGKRSGLWTEFKRIISEVQPRFVLIENVPALTFRGLDVVLSDLAEIGYDAEWQCISASEVGAWHKRERIWIVAHPNEISTNTRYNDAHREGNEERVQRRCRSQSFPESLDKVVSNSEGIGIQKGERLFEQGDREIPNTKTVYAQRFEDRQEQRKFRRGGWWAVEPELGRVAHGIPDRVDRLKSLGNAIVPQVAYIIMRQLKEVM